MGTQGRETRVHWCPRNRESAHMEVSGGSGNAPAEKRLLGSGGRFAPWGEWRGQPTSRTVLPRSGQSGRKPVSVQTIEALMNPLYQPVESEDDFPLGAPPRIGGIDLCRPSWRVSIGMTPIRPNLPSCVELRRDRPSRPKSQPDLDESATRMISQTHCWVMRSILDGPSASRPRRSASPGGPVDQLRSSLGRLARVPDAVRSRAGG